MVRKGLELSDCKTSISSTTYKKFKLDMPEVVAKKNTETSIPYPFPFPSNYRPEVEVCLKSGKMTSEARKNFLSSIASAIFSFKRLMSYNIGIPV